MEITFECRCGESKITIEGSVIKTFTCKHCGQPAVPVMVQYKPEQDKESATALDTPIGVGNTISSIVMLRRLLSCLKQAPTDTTISFKSLELSKEDDKEKIVDVVTTVKRVWNGYILGYWFDDLKLFKDFDTLVHVLWDKLWDATVRIEKYLQSERKQS